MTKNEAEILKYPKPLVSAEKNDVLARFNDKGFSDHSSDKCSIIRHEDRLNCLIAFGCIESNGTTLNITPKGLHELDEYIENTSRLRRAEIFSTVAMVGSILAAVFSFVELFI